MKIILVSVVLAAAFTPSLSHADDSFIPYMNPDGPQPREMQCQIADQGTVYYNGNCYFQNDADDSFTVTTEDTKYSAMVGPINGNFHQAMWTEEAFAGHMHGQLHEVERSTDDPACRENDEPSVCAW